MSISKNSPEEKSKEDLFSYSKTFTPANYFISNIKNPIFVLTSLLLGFGISMQTSDALSVPYWINFLIWLGWFYFCFMAMTLIKAYRRNLFKATFVYNLEKNADDVVELIYIVKYADLEKESIKMRYKISAIHKKKNCFLIQTSKPVKMKTKLQCSRLDQKQISVLSKIANSYV